MRRDSLLDFFSDLEGSRAEFIAYDDGLRHWTFSYEQIAALARAFAARLRREGVGPTDKVILWAENRAEWLIAFWGCLLEGVVVVPIDYRASADLLRSVQRIVDAKAVLIGEDVPHPETGRVPVWRLTDLSADTTPPATVLPQRSTGGGQDVAEVIFTSGATADPKGVVITHGNVLANIVPVEREIRRYRRYAWPFSPVRFLNLLPLSHMFGQAMATFIPPMLRGTVVFMRGYNPVEIVRLVRSRRVSVLTCVPKILEVLKEHVVRTVPEAAEAMTDGPRRSIPQRWWRYRAVHRLFGWKFWSFVVGAAPLDPELEAFWSRLGFLVIQGYGLTETAPIVTLNHPFRSKRGSVGRPIAGVEVKLGDDGEILVRGDNVTSGYYGAPDDTAASFTDGWFHTGDIGALDADGRLSVRGRKKEVIVTPEGLNVFPDDIERVLNQDPGVEDSAVIGLATGAEERVHAVLVLSAGAARDDIIRRVNGRLEDHQKIRGASAWPGGELPRTEGTRKLKRREIRQWAAAGAGAPPAPRAAASATVEDVVATFAEGRTVTATTTLDELGLSSLERMELMMALEQRFDATVDEMAFAAAATVGDLRGLVVGAGTCLPSAPRAPQFEFPSWNRRRPARVLRRLSLATWILPIARLFVRLEVGGREHLDGLPGPVIFAANHQSHIDTPAILSALPGRWRYRVAPAMAKEFFKAHFFPANHPRRARFTSSLSYYLAALFFNAFPLPQREAGTRQTLRYIGDLVSDGYCPLIFPEGRRDAPDEIEAFQPGVGMIAARLEVPVVPVRIFGASRVLPQRAHMARPGRVRVAFGAPLLLEGDDYADLAHRVEAAVRALR
ncbi:MAG: AMP-binding protein [Vicinamibacterales bacterium]|jgi:long-chain acyl-CoA synthetase|nr:hypothetical protein [Acidobacteriota bacterium]MDP6374130.1 AMP-binding protein [Vicinamibacterales bacterium]MDP6610605.1 AMP-binding protein [Vicinamibacterales bacterium]|tara:strand:- start:4526 stop:7045 length:2520 start_codon:yes stop_codon:yes gene_type:complete